jgi:hypothetical protein
MGPGQRFSSVKGGEGGRVVVVEKEGKQNEEDLYIIISPLFLIRRL